MRAAVDFGSTVPAFDRLWTEAAHAIAEAVTVLLARGGVPLGIGPDEAPALARVLCWMLERSFYQASRISVEDLDTTRQSCQSAWLHVLADQ